MTIEEQYTHAKNTLNGRLFAPYQREGVLWMLTMERQQSGPKGGFLCDEMGLGKTIQVIGLVAHLMTVNVVGPFLVVAPLATLPNWVREFEK